MRAVLRARGEAGNRNSKCARSQRRSAVNSRSRSRWQYRRVPHGLCHFHYLREAIKPIYEADRHAKKELKKQVRLVCAIERSIAQSNEQVAETVRDYCLAVRSALTSDGRPPLVASGLELNGTKKSRNTCGLNSLQLRNIFVPGFGH